MAHGLDGLDLNRTVYGVDQIGDRACQCRGISARAHHHAGVKGASPIWRVHYVCGFLADTEIDRVRDHANDPQGWPTASSDSDFLPDCIVSRKIMPRHRAA